jgi:hypothetical protein
MEECVKIATINHSDDREKSQGMSGLFYEERALEKCVILSDIYKRLLLYIF